MAEKTKPQDPIEEEDQEGNSFLDVTRKVLLAGIGAMALAQEEIEKFIHQLIDRGEIAEKDGRKLLHEVMDKRKRGAEKAEDEVTKRVETVLDRMSVPSKADIDALSQKISELSKKVDELKKH
ncbi:MAG: phasin family protein [Anaerolineales bacterium]|nr:phasin family protein [Anaerolineales bacterium]